MSNTMHSKMQKTEALPLRTLDLRGAHRGGGAATRALLECGSLPRLQVQLVDNAPARASQLATTWSGAGHSALAVHADALDVPIERNVDVLGLCTDDARVQLHLMESSRARLVVMGLIVASNTAEEYGGHVLGFGATIPEDDPVTRRAAGQLFQEIVRLTDGQRVTSRAVSNPLLNSLQLDTVRDLLYQRLARDAQAFLSEGGIQGSLYVATASPEGATFPLDLRLRQGRSRSQMQDVAQAATQIAAKSAQPTKRRNPQVPKRSTGIGSTAIRATAFTEEATESRSPWLYVVIPHPSTPKGRSPRTVELPASPAAPLVRQARQQRLAVETAAREASDREAQARREMTRQVVYATD